MILKLPSAHQTELLHISKFRHQNWPIGASDSSTIISTATIITTGIIVFEKQVEQKMLISITLVNLQNLISGGYAKHLTY